MSNTSSQEPRSIKSESTAFTRLISPEEAGSLVSRIRHSSILRWTLLAISVGLLVLLFPHSTDIEQSRETGSIWSGDTVRAAFSFPLYKDEQTVEQEQKEAQDSILLMFIPTGITPRNMADTLRGIALLADSSLVQLSLLSEQSRQWINSLSEENRESAVRRIISQLTSSITGLFPSGFIDRARSSIQQDRIVIRRGTAYEEEVSIKPLYDSILAIQTLETDLARRGIQKEEYLFALDLFREIWQPTYRYSSTLTEEAQQMAANAVSKDSGSCA